jgi:hypothetical protein
LCSASPHYLVPLAHCPNYLALKNYGNHSQILEYYFPSFCDLIQIMENLPTQLAHLQRGNRRQSVAPPSPAQWEGVKETVRRVYIENGRNKDDMRNIMILIYHFEAT